jgi:hypothetical protein
MKLIEALQNTRTFLETMGYSGGDIHDDLNLAICLILNKYPKVSQEELPCSE